MCGDAVKKTIFERGYIEVKYIFSLQGKLGIGAKKSRKGTSEKPKIFSTKGLPCSAVLNGLVCHNQTITMEMEMETKVLVLGSAGAGKSWLINSCTGGVDSPGPRAVESDRMDADGTVEVMRIPHGKVIWYDTPGLDSQNFQCSVKQIKDKVYQDTSFSCQVSYKLTVVLVIEEKRMTTWVQAFKDATITLLPSCSRIHVLVVSRTPLSAEREEQVKNGLKGDKDVFNLIFCDRVNINEKVRQYENQLPPRVAPVVALTIAQTLIKKTAGIKKRVGWFLGPLGIWFNDIGNKIPETEQKKADIILSTIKRALDASQVGASQDLCYLGDRNLEFVLAQQIYEEICSGIREAGSLHDAVVPLVTNAKLAVVLDEYLKLDPKLKAKVAELKLAEHAKGNLLEAAIAMLTRDPAGKSGYNAIMKRLRQS
jgi:GTPase SAR1 family protein